MYDGGKGGYNMNTCGYDRRPEYGGGGGSRPPPLINRGPASKGWKRGSGVPVATNNVLPPPPAMYNQHEFDGPPGGKSAFSKDFNAGYTAGMLQFDGFYSRGMSKLPHTV